MVSSTHRFTWVKSVRPGASATPEALNHPDRWSTRMNELADLGNRVEEHHLPAE